MIKMVWDPHNPRLNHVPVLEEFPNHSVHTSSTAQGGGGSFRIGNL